jgi:ketosteroid isomerase-like protein
MRRFDSGLRALLLSALVAGLVSLWPTNASAEEPAPAGDPAAAQAGENDLDKLRKAMFDAYTRQSVSGMTNYLHPDVIVVFPDGQVLRGRQQLVDYTNSKLQGPDAVLQSFSSNPQVLERAIHGDTAVSHGVMNDNYVLKNGESFNLDSKFTVTAVKLPDGPAETGGWVVRSFHASSNVFDGPVLLMAIKKSMTPAFIFGAALGLLAGAGGMFLITRRKPKP